MRTKTLLLTAAIGAAGIASSMAQAVYSVNYVGYVNKTLVPGYQIIANPLNNGANTPEVLFTAPNFGDTIYKHDPVAGFQSASYFGSWLGASLTLPVGEGFFYFNAGATALNVTFVGEGEEGPNLINSLPSGLSIRASRIPQAGTLAPTGPGGGQLEFPNPSFGDTVYQYDTTLVPPGYKSSSWFGSWLPSTPDIAVAEGFWYQNAAATALVWERDYEVTP